MAYSLTFTHCGWFGICPVRIANLDSEAPVLEARHWWLEWLFDISATLYGLSISAQDLLDPDFEPMWPIRVTGEIDPPLIKRYDDDHNEIRPL